MWNPEGQDEVPEQLEGVQGRVTSRLNEKELFKVVRAADQNGFCVSKSFLGLSHLEKAFVEKLKHCGAYVNLFWPRSSFGMY